MTALVTKEQAAEYLGLKPKAAERLLESLGVRKINFAIMGGKGIRYRRIDIDEALEQITTEKQEKPKAKRPKKRDAEVFSLSIKEQMVFFLTNSGPAQ